VLDFTVIVAVAQCQPELSVRIISKCITLLLSWNSFRTFSTPYAVSFIASAVFYGVEFASQNLSPPTLYLPPFISTQYLFITDIYSTSLHTQADSRLFIVFLPFAAVYFNHLFIAVTLSGFIFDLHVTSI
jgi:hypothetical protein